MWENLKSFLQNKQSTLISGLSAFLIIMLGFLLFSYFSRVNKQSVTRETSTVEQTTPEGLLTEATKSSIFDSKPATPSAQKQASTSPAPVKKEETGKYTVVRGDTLSTIALSFYGEADKHTLISSLKENNVTNPDLIHAGNVFTIPPSQLTQATPQLSQVKRLPSSGISPQDTSKQHTVAPGDTLWDLATKYYGNGFGWTKILEANDDRVGYLPNDTAQKALILPGQVLFIPNG